MRVGGAPADDVLSLRPAIYRRLIAVSDLGLRPQVLGHGTLEEIGHVLEDLVLDHHLEGAVFTGFQDGDERLWAFEQYQRRVPAAQRSVEVVEADGSGPIDDEGIFRVRVAEDDTVRDEWFLLVVTGGFSVAMVGADTGEDTGEDTPGRASRRFETVIATTPGSVRSIGEFLCLEVARRDIDTARRMLDALRRWAPGAPYDRVQDLVVTRLLGALDASRSRADAAVEALEETVRVLRRSGAAPPGTTTGASASTPSVDVAAVVRRCVEGSGLADRIDVVAPVSLPTGAGGAAVQRLLGDLLASVDWYAPHGPVAVLLSDAGDRVRLTVSDRGPGVPEDQREAVLAGTAVGSFRGTDGAIGRAAAIASAAGGTVRIEEPIGGGTRVVVELPARPFGG